MLASNQRIISKIGPKCFPPCPLSKDLRSEVDKAFKKKKKKEKPKPAHLRKNQGRQISSLITGFKVLFLALQKNSSLLCLVSIFKSYNLLWWIWKYCILKMWIATRINRLCKETHSEQNCNSSTDKVILGLQGTSALGTIHKPYSIVLTVPDSMCHSSD